MIKHKQKIGSSLRGGRIRFVSLSILCFIMVRCFGNEDMGYEWGVFGDSLGVITLPLF